MAGYLWDMQQAALAVRRFCDGKTLADFERDELLRSAVERQLSILGEALFQAVKLDPSLTEAITDCSSIIHFRHVLVHGYLRVNTRVVWSVYADHLGLLEDEVAALLGDQEERPT